MRDSKSRTRKTTNNSDVDNAQSLQTELELIAVKAKNADLIKAHTKLMHENAEMENQIYSLQADLVDMEAKYNNLKFALKNIEQSMKRCTPNLIDVLNLFWQVTNSKRNNLQTLTSIDRVSNRSSTSRAKAITHTVIPHMVNGTVLNLVPTISLTRLNTTNTNQGINEVSSGSQFLHYRNSSSSASTGVINKENQNENLSPNFDTSEVENQSFVSRRKNISIPKLPLDGSVEAKFDIETENSFDESEEEEAVRRLSSIQEESTGFNKRFSERKQTSLEDVRLYLSQISNKDLHVRQSQNTYFSSIDGNINDTSLNIETTVIENPENQSKRLRDDIMVLSPHTNSTRMGNDDSLFDDVGLMDDRRKVSVSAVSAIQSAKVTPSIENKNDGLFTPCGVNWLPTPSMSAMGDIDTSNKKLEILKECYDAKYPTNKNNAPECFLVTPVIQKRYSRSSNKVKTRSNTKSDDESPRTSVENHNGNKSIKTFINQQRGASSHRPLTPTILLDRLENILPERGGNASAVQWDEHKENENQPKRTMMRSKRSKAEGKSPKKSVKRKLEDDEEEWETGIFQAKIREIHIRLSNCIPEAADNSMESSENKNERPKRAARPKTLRDASLKGKLRRMF